MTACARDVAAFEAEARRLGLAIVELGAQRVILLPLAEESAEFGPDTPKLREAWSRLRTGGST